MLSHGWRRFLLLVAAGAIAALSVPPLFMLPALFVGLPIWVWCLDGAERHRGLRAFFGPAFGIGFAFGLGYFSVALHWIGAAFLQEGGWFIVLMPFAVLALAAVLALFWAARQRAGAPALERRGAAHRDAGDLPQRRRIRPRAPVLRLPLRPPGLRADRQRRDDAAGLGHRGLRADPARGAARHDAGADLAGRRARPGAAAGAVLSRRRRHRRPGRLGQLPALDHRAGTSATTCACGWCSR